ncbi:MAG: nuclear transport factor 2 family protein [Chloroflexi bacterium]|nr:nuclear transport factor 2 family protein [Chloroflexota bacterium]
MSQAPAKFKAFYERQIEFLANNDAVGLIANQYTEDAELLSFTNHIVGAPALVEYFKGYIANLGYIKLISTDKYTEGNSSIFFEATVETAGGIARVYDVFVLRDGKIAHHFTGLLGFTPHAQN